MISSNISAYERDFTDPDEFTITGVLIQCKNPLCKADLVSASRDNLYPQVYCSKECAKFAYSVQGKEIIQKREEQNYLWSSSLRQAQES